MTNVITPVPELRRDKKHDYLPWVYIGVSGFLLALFIYPILFRTESMGNQLDLFFKRGENFFADLYNVCVYSSERDPYFNTFGEDAEKAYFPLSYLISFVMGRLICFDGYQGSIYSVSPIELIGSILLLAITMVVLSILVYNSIKGSVIMRTALVLVFLTSGPVMFAAERWNLIFYTVIGMIIFLTTYDSENKVLRELGYLSLAFAAALKGFPAVLGVLLLYRKEWKEAVRLAVYGAIGAFVPFLFVKHGFGAVSKWLSNLHLNNEMYKFRNEYGYSYFVVHNQSLTEDKMTLILDNMYLVLIITAALAIIGASFVKREWIRIALIISFIIIIPANSGYYTLMYFIPLVTALIRGADRGAAEYIAAVVLAVIMMPFRLPGSNWFCDTPNTAFAVNVLLMAVFILSSLHCIVAGITGLTGIIKQKRGLDHGKTQPA